MAEFTTEATRPIPAGQHQIRMEFAYDGGGLGKGGNVTLHYDGEKAGEGRVQATQPMIFSADETTDIWRPTGFVDTSIMPLAPFSCQLRIHTRRGSDTLVPSESSDDCNTLPRTQTKPA